MASDKEKEGGFFSRLLGVVVGSALEVGIHVGAESLGIHLRTESEKEEWAQKIIDAGYNAGINGTPPQIFSLEGNSFNEDERKLYLIFFQLGQEARNKTPTDKGPA